MSFLGRSTAGVVGIGALSALALSTSLKPDVRPAAPSVQDLEQENTAHSSGVPVVVLDLPTESAFHPKLGEHRFPSQELWRPMCTSDGARLSQSEFETYVRRHKEIVANDQQSVIVDNHANYGTGSLNVIFSASGSIPSGALAALAVAEAYIEGVFNSDPITVTIPVSFQVMSSNILGGTSSSYGYLTYADTRTLLTGNVDGNDTMQAFLPTGTTCPVRYNGNTGTVTNENRVFFTYANYEATGGIVSGDDANMTFNSIFAFDYDPSNGVPGTQYSFVDVVIHETGHALGCTSGGDFRVNDLEVMDLFRFQRTDGTGDYNPDTNAEFQSRARLVSYNKPNDAHNTDLISVEYRMSDGSPYQMSHLREQAPNIGLMDPALAPGETFYPAYFSTADIALFDMISYDK